MAIDMELKSLGDLYDIRSGLSKPGSEFGEGHPFLTFKDVFYNTFVPENLGDLVRSTESERLLCDIRRGDVFMTRTSETMDELGMSCVALRDVPFATFNGFTKRLRPKDQNEIVPEFIAYYLRSEKFRQGITAMSSLSTRASLNNDMLNRLSVLLPKKDVQEKIGFALKSFDDKIEHNRKKTRAIEALVSAMFRAIFLNYDPVKAKAAGFASFPSMSQAGFDLLPVRFLESESGSIPEGWEIKALSDVCLLIGGGTPKRTEGSYWDGGIPWYSVRDVPDEGAVWFVSTDETITEEGVLNSSARIVPKGCTIISARGTVGKLAMAGMPTTFNQSCYGLLPKDGSSFCYLYLLMKSVVGDIQQRAHGSVFDTITRNTFDSVSIVSPKEDIVSAFESTVSPLFDLILAAEVESRKLAEMRDYLSPKLIGGSVRMEATSG